MYIYFDEGIFLAHTGYLLFTRFSVALFPPFPLLEFWLDLVLWRYYRPPMKSSYLPFVCSHLPLVLSAMVYSIVNHLRFD